MPEHDTSTHTPFINPLTPHHSLTHSHTHTHTHTHTHIHTYTNCTPSWKQVPGFAEGNSCKRRRQRVACGHQAQQPREVRPYDSKEVNFTWTSGRALNTSQRCRRFLSGLLPSESSLLLPCYRILYHYHDPTYVLFVLGSDHFFGLRLCPRINWNKELPSELIAAGKW